MKGNKQIKNYYNKKTENKIKDYVNGNLRVERAWQKLLLWAPKNPRQILEIGCGVGYICARMKEVWPDARVVGIDISSESIKKAEDLFPNAGIEFKEGSISDAVPGGEFDLIVLMDVYEHIELNERKLLHAFLNKNLSSTGRIFISFPTPNFLEYLKINHPDNLQPVDEHVTLNDINILAQDTSSKPLYYRKISVWRPSDYAHAIVSRTSDFFDCKMDYSDFLVIDQTEENIDKFIIRTGILKAIEETLPNLNGGLLDVGCGRMPYKPIILANGRITNYIGLDFAKGAYAEQQKPDLTWNGEKIPLDDNTVDNIIAIEVFEHIPHPEVVLNEIRRVLTPGGVFFFTIPFLWPLHDIPNDECRYTPFSFERHLKNSGFSGIDLKPLGGWNAALAQMIGLWVKRKPMSEELRPEYINQLLPFYNELLNSDFKSNNFAEQNMFIGIWGTSTKPAISQTLVINSQNTGEKPTITESQLKFHNKKVPPEADKKGKIVVIQGGFPAISATFILDQITGFIDRGIDIENWSTYNPNENALHPDILKYRLLKKTRYLKFPPDHLKNSSNNWVEEFFILNEIENLEKIDAFHVHYGSNFNLMEPLFRFYKDKFVIVSFHGYDASKYFQKNGDNCYKYLFERANLITTPSFTMKNELVKRGCAPKKMHVHRCGVDLSKFHCDSKGDDNSHLNLLTVARLVEKKGLEYSLKAVASMSNRKKIIYRIVGDGPLRVSLRALAKNLGIENQVKFLGAQTKDEVIKAMSKADIFLLNSITAQDGDMEGLPVSLVEAQAMGLPVVSSNHAGIPELVIDGETGFLTEEKDVSTISERLEKLISNPHLRKTFSDNAKKRTKAEFDIEILNNRLKRNFEICINSPKHQARKFGTKQIENSCDTRCESDQRKFPQKNTDKQDNKFTKKEFSHEVIEDLTEIKTSFQNLNWDQKIFTYEKYFEYAEILNGQKTSDISIIIVCERYSNDLLRNLKLLNKQRFHNFRLILINNGSDDYQIEKLTNDVDVYVKLNKNTGAYLSRNIGALFANAPILLFIDDDGIPETKLIEAHLNAFKKYNVVAVRGVCLPKTDNPLNNLAKHYYLGAKPFPIYADIEGNTSYLSNAFFKAGGWDDDISFGGGGVDLSRRLLDAIPDHRKQIYSPEPIIYHDYAIDENHLKSKRMKQNKSREKLKNKYHDYDAFLASWSQFRARDDLLLKRDTSKQNATDFFEDFVSILIPAYNREQYIARAIDSALAQSHKNIEVLVIDDGSTDNTKNILNEFSSDKLRYICKDHTGAPDTRNRAIEEAKGKYLLWLDSDDVLLPDTITNYTLSIADYPDVDVFYGDLVIIDSFGNFRQDLKYPDYYEQNDALLSRLLIGNSVPNPGTLIRKSVYQTFGKYRLKFKRAHDYEFWARVAKQIKFKHVGAPVCKWRWHDSNMSSGSVQFDTSYDIQIKRDLLKSHSLKEFFPQLNWNEEKKSLETAYFVIGNSFSQLKGYQEAIAYYEKCLEINKCESYYCALGLTYFQLEDLEKSICAFNEALKINPKNEKASEISENLKKILNAKNQKQQINSIAVDLDTDQPRCLAKEIGPLVSVIVPTFNRAQMLIESVKSILSQTYQNFEIVVVNDGGEDVSGLVDCFQDPRVKYISHLKNKGLAASRNTGIRNASGQYIALLDDDDLFYSEHLKTAVNALCTEIPVVYTDAFRATYDKRGDNYHLISKNVPYSIDFDRNKLLVGNLSPVNCFVFEKSLALKAGLFDETLSTLEDWDFWIRLSSLTSFKHIPDPTVQVNWRNDGTTMTSKLGAEFKKNRQKIYDKYRDEINQIPNVEEILNEFQEIWAQDWQVASTLTSIIILTCNQLQYTKKCIDSIFQNTQNPYELIIVDNGSTDGTIEYLESEILKNRTDVRKKIIKNRGNKGFAGGNNQGIAVARGDYILLLNNDVVVTLGWLGRMISCAEKKPEIGIVGPRSNYVSGPQLVEGVEYDTQTLKGLIEFSNKISADNAGQAQQILRVVGFCMLIKRAVIDKIGGMDDRYGLGNFEDDDFSLRATIAGFQSWIARDCFIHHFGHRTFIGEKVDLSKSLHKNWGVFKDKWGLPAEKPYGSPYRLSEMNNTWFDPSIHYYPLDIDSAGMKISGRHSKTAEALYSAIHTHLNTKPSEDVIKDLQNLITSYPEFALAYNDLGVLYYTAGNKDKALHFYEKAVELDPENMVFQKNVADFYYVEMGRVEDALRTYVKILEAHPEDVETLLITGHICVALEKFQDAKVFYNRVLEIEPGHQDARQFLDKLHSMEAGNPGAKTPQALYDVIQPLLNNGDPHRAIAALEDLLEKFPDNALAYNDLGVLYYHTGNKEKAQHHYERAVEMMPENINFQKNLADFYCLELGRIEEALNIYVGILNTHPRDIETLLATGQICVALERPDDAKAFYHRVLELEPGNEDAGNYLQTLDKHSITEDLSPSGSVNTVSVLTDKLESNDLEPGRSGAENRAATVSIIISLDGIQNCVKECIISVITHTPDPHEILFINRGATKGMLKWVQQLVEDKDQYRIIEGARQAGWAESLNRAVHKASGDMIVLIHNDAVVPEGWLNAFKILINLEPNIGVMGPMSNRAEGAQQMIPFDEFGRVEFESAAKTFYEQYQSRRVTTRKLSDFCLAFPRELFDKIGYFDEQFVSGKFIIEDFCQRAVSGGYQNLIAADTYVHHYDRHKAPRGASAKKKANAKDRKKYNEKWNGAQNPQAEALATVYLLARAEELSHKGQIDPAVELLLGAIGVRPEDPRVYLGLSEILLTAKRFQDAKDALSEMPPADENQEMRKAQLLAYAEEGLENYETAQAQIDQVLLMNPGHAPALNLKGILAYRNDDCVSAEKYFKRAIDSDPGYGEPYTNLGMLSLEADRPQNALKFFEKAFRLTPADLDIATNYHSYIGAMADFIRAELLAREAAALYPNNQKIKYMLIDFLVQQGKYEMAMPEIEDAIIKFGSDNGILGAALKVREKLGPITIQKLSPKFPVSVCMIIKDEEKYLARCLASVKPIVDEMIVVDTGSTDRSKDIAIAFGARVYDYEWQNDFAEARNYSISQASGEWILILDGDEVISALDHEHFNKLLKKTPRAPIAYSIITRNYNKLANIVGWMPNDGKYPDEEAAIGWLPSEKVRLFYGRDQIWFEGPVHELVDPVLKRNGIEIKKCSIPVHHYGRLDKEKLDRKGEIYFDIGRKKLSAMGDDLNALRELAIQATILEKNQEAFELWQRLLALNPNPHLAAIAYVNLGTIYNRLGKFEDALDAGKKAVKFDPDLKEARYNHAMAELHCGNAPQTIGVLEDLLKGFPDYPPARFILSAAYCCADQREKGLQGLRELKDTPMGAHLDIPCIELAQSLIAAGKREYASWVLQAAIECDIVNPKLLTLFKECLDMKEVTQNGSHIPQPPQANLQEAILENRPQ